MRLKFSLRKILTVIATLATLANSFAVPSIAIAQELSTPTPVDTSTPTPTVAPTENPTATPDATPAETTTPTPEVTATPDLVTPAPTETPTVTQAPESNPTTTAPPADSNSSSTAQPTLSATPTASPEPQDNPSIASTVLTTNVFPQTIQDNSWFKLITDKLDYSPTEIVQISGSGFIPDKDYTLEIVSTDTPPVDFTTQVKADGSGNINYSYQLDGNYRPNYTVYIKNGKVVVTTVTFTDGVNPDVNLDQCRNGSASSPYNCLNLGGSHGWVNGNAGNSDSHYVEGYSIPYRAVMTNLPTATTITIDLGYDITHSSHDAIDFLTYYNRLEPHTPFGHSAETVTPTDGVSGLSATTSTFSIPAPSSTGSPVTGQPTNSFNALPAGERVMTLFGGTISNIAYVSQGNLSDAQAETVIRVTFTADSPSAVLAWGGHIATRVDWGFNGTTPRSAGGISGSPYHMRLDSWSLGNLGNTDKSLSAGAVIPPSNITIHKVTDPAGGTGFGFSATGGISPSTFSLNDGGSQNFSAAPGTYSIIENDPSPSYLLSNLACTASGTGTSATPDKSTRSVSVTIGASGNGTVDCTYTNSLQQAHLTLVKTITKDNGGQAVATDWTLNATSTNGSISGTTGSVAVTNAAVNQGTYTLSESGPSGYTPSDWSCVKNGGNAVLGSSITLAGGDSATCTINNNDDAPSLTLTKIVSNTHGGNAVPANWTLSADGPTPISGAGGATSDSTFKAGIYTLSESTGPAGYSAGSWSCVGATIANGNQITLAVGQSASCSITNSDQQAYITVTKVVHNDHGGAALPNDFKLTLDGKAVLSGVKVEVNPGSHTAAETQLPGYTFDGFSGDCTTASLSVALGESKTCTLTNSDKQAYITVIKNVIKDNGGTANPDDFKLTLEGSAVLSGVAVPVDPGTYTAAETQQTGYSFSGFSGACGSDGKVTVALGESKTCTLTNDDIAPSLTLVKNVINNYGGNEPATAWTLYASSGPTPISGAGGVVSDGTFKAGTYTLSESAGPLGYIPGNWSCTGDATNTGNSITLSLGQNATCSITNSDVPASITVDKITNPSGASDLFTFNLSGPITGSAQLSDASTPYTFSGLSVGTYSLTEEDVAGWDLTNVSCTLNRQTSTNIGVSLGLGDSLNCTFTNTEKGHLIVEKTTDPANDPTVFDITASGTGTITGGGTGTVSDTKDQDYEVTPGTYSVSESLLGSSDWNNTGNTCTDVVVGAGETKSCQLTNQKKGTIVIKKVMIGGTDTFSFSGNVSGTISANNGTIISGGKTPKNGFTSTESPKAGWELTSISCDDNNSTGDVRTRTATFNVDPGETVTCTFTNTKYGYMQGRKYIDANMDGRLENGESFLDNWTVRLYNSTWQPLGAYTTGTGGLLTGQYKFGNLLPGIYNTCEVQQTGYQQTGPLLGAHAVDYNGNQVNGSIAVANGSGQTDEAPICWQSTINGNGMEWLGFGNIQLGKIIVEKETNKETEDRFTFSSNYSKNFTLGNGGRNDSGYLLPGDYSVSELTQNGWQLGSATCDNEDSPSNIHLGAGDIVTCRFVNNELVPGVSITKSNDSASGITAGATVTYTLNVKNTGSIDFNNVYVYDYLPGGFTYVSGSVSGADFISLVGSKLTLNLSSLAAGATATITYKVSTNSALANGTYTNYATCQARYYEESILPCDPANSNVSIGNGIGYGGNMQGQVLGASTELPATGSPTELLIISLAILGLGIFLNGYTMRKQKKALKKASKKKASKKKSKRHAKK